MSSVASRQLGHPAKVSRATTAFSRPSEAAAVACTAAVVLGGAATAAGYPNLHGPAIHQVRLAVRQCLQVVNRAVEVAYRELKDRAARCALLAAAGRLPSTTAHEDREDAEPGSVQTPRIVPPSSAMPRRVPADGLVPDRREAQVSRRSHSHAVRTVKPCSAGGRGRGRADRVRRRDRRQEERARDHPRKLPSRARPRYPQPHSPGRSGRWSCQPRRSWRRAAPAVRAGSSRPRWSRFHRAGSGPAPASRPTWASDRGLRPRRRTRSRARGRWPRGVCSPRRAAPALRR